MSEASLFPDLPTVREKPTGIVRSAMIDGNYRWTLSRVWRAGPHVCWIGVNPSTADHKTDDPTVQRWTHFSNAWGFGGFVAVNLYPFRSPNIAACRKWADWENNGPDWHARDRLHHNADFVAREAKKASMVVASWGAAAWDDAWIEYVIGEVQEGEAPWPDLYCLGKTMDGSPTHPMARGLHRVPDGTRPIIWRKR